MSEALLTISAVLNGVLITSYVLEHFLFLSFDLTILIGVVAVLITAVHIFVRGAAPTPMPTDGWVAALAFVVLANAFRGGEQPLLASKIVLSAITPYFMGRVIGRSPRAVKVWAMTILLTGVAFTFSLLPRLLEGNAFRLGIGDANQVASGDVLALAAALAGGIWSISPERPVIAAKMVGPLSVLVQVTILAVLVIGVGARGACVALLAAMVIVHVLRQERLTFKSLLPLAALGCLGGGVATIGQLGLFPGAERFTLSYLIQDPSFVGYQATQGYSAGRLDLWAGAVQAFGGSPLIGTGVPAVSAHNMFLEAAANYGLVGLVILTGTVVSIILLRPFTRARRSPLIALLLISASYLFLYRQTSFQLEGNKSLFIVTGMLVTLLSRRDGAWELTAVHPTGLFSGVTETHAPKLESSRKGIVQRL